MATCKLHNNNVIKKQSTFMAKIMLQLFYKVLQSLFADDYC